MIHTLLSKGLLLLHPATAAAMASPVDELKIHLRKLPSKALTDRHLDHLNLLAHAYLFRERLAACQAPGTAARLAILEDLKSPAYRLSLISHLPCSLHRLLQLDETSRYRSEISRLLCLAPALEHRAVIIANQPPFHEQGGPIYHFDELAEKLETPSLLAIICAAILWQHCLAEKGDEGQDQLFRIGLVSAHIHMQLALADNHPSPLRSFLLSLLHYVSLLYISRELQGKNLITGEKELLHELDQLAPRLCYWIAKDWGLPDDILLTLKERFQQPHHLSPTAQVMQKCEHASLALLLYHNGLFSRRQIQKLLPAMDIDSDTLSSLLMPHSH